jgi:RNA polymerase sigma-70 factor (ECF subfamily)
MPQPSTAHPLLGALAAGKSEAFAELYDMLAVRLHKTAGTIAGSREDAEDALQDLFVRLARQRERFLQVIDLEAYVFASLRHGLLAQVRRRSMERRHLRRIARQRPVEAAASSLPDDELAVALQELPIEQREVIALKVDASLTFAQIADVLRISANTAASRYRYAMEKLRARLEK